MRERRVFIAGGGNSAGQAAIHLAKYAAVRDDAGPRPRTRARACPSTSSATIGARPASASAPTSRSSRRGRGRLEQADAPPTAPAGGSSRSRPRPLRAHRRGAAHRLAARRDVARRMGLRRDRERTSSSRAGSDRHGRSTRPPMLLESSVPGVFAVGDVRHRSIKRVASAVGEGSRLHRARPRVPRAGHLTVSPRVGAHSGSRVSS